MPGTSCLLCSKVFSLPRLSSRTNINQQDFFPAVDVKFFCMNKELADFDARIGGDWLTIQQKYWESWLNLAPKVFGVFANNAAERQNTLDTPAENPFFRFAGTPYSATLPAIEAYFNGILKLNQLSTRMMEQFVIGARGGLNVPDHRLSDLKDADHAKRLSEIKQDGVALWDLPLDTWRRTMSAMLPLPGDFLYATKDEGITRVTAELRERLDRFLGIPSVGFSREYLDQYQRFASLYLDYLESLQEYNVAFSYIGVRAGETFLEKLTRESTSRPINSLRKLYDLWVDAYEETYSEYVMSEEYASLHGRLINALVAVKHEGSLIVDEFLDGMNMPTRREINTMHRRLSDLQRQNHSLKTELEHILHRLGPDTAQIRSSLKPSDRPL